ncbi:uncharacterized protein LOC134531760 isoform X6 [Bacillus rossius redtenbacheri]|uniref:uncharacterized protein LOC134531760 isoform X6 n=1 Tax=Bacillus rossius redtenbacheri TaxID=93214 RepID=UPI002FDD241B
MLSTQHQGLATGHTNWKCHFLWPPTQPTEMMPGVKKKRDLWFRLQERDSTETCFSGILRKSPEKYQQSTNFSEKTPEQQKVLAASCSTNKCQSEQQQVTPDGSNVDTEASFVISGRRITDIDYFFNRLKVLCNHGPLGCGIQNLVITNEARRGLNSIFSVKCNMCNFQDTLHTENPKSDSMDINTAAVTGSVCIGIGHRQLEELTAAMDIPTMSANTYAKYHDKVSDGWEKTAIKEMGIAVQREAQLAVERGDVDEDGFPVLTVIADGQWSKRSYKNSNYSSLSGVAAIIGFYTRKVLFISV